MTASHQRSRAMLFFGSALAFGVAAYLSDQLALLGAAAAMVGAAIVTLRRSANHS